MGGCMSTVTGGGGPYISSNDGGEQEFHARYLEGDLLGQGEFGAVMLCQDVKAGKGSEELAVKILKKGMTFKDNTVYSALKPQVLQAECDILKTLNGKNYCLELKGIYETPKVIYVVTELCSGGEMMDYVSKQKELRTEDVSRISFQLLSAVNHCAKHGIIHRDLKAENLMFRSQDKDAELRLIDFGCGAYDKQTASSKELIQHTTFVGSAFYMSPEMFQHTYTCATDVWSAGVTLYVLVGGYPADELQKAFNTLHTSKRAKRNLRSLPNLPSNLPESYFDLFEQLLTFHHKSRPTAGDMLQHEFVQFHKSIGKSKVKMSRTASVLFKGSVARHGLVLQYQKFERAVTTILATMLNHNDLESLLERLEQKNNTVNAQKLKVIPMVELKAVLKDMNQDQCIDMINNLPNASSYDTFAYHIALLQQFSRVKDSSSSNYSPAAKRSMSISVGVSKMSDDLMKFNNLVETTPAKNGMVETASKPMRSQSVAVTGSKPMRAQSLAITGRTTDFADLQPFEGQKIDLKTTDFPANGGSNGVTGKGLATMDEEEEECFDA